MITSKNVSSGWMAMGGNFDDLDKVFRYFYKVKELELVDIKLSRSAILLEISNINRCPIDSVSIIAMMNLLSSFLKLKEFKMEFTK